MKILGFSIDDLKYSVFFYYMLNICSYCQPGQQGK